MNKTLSKILEEFGVNNIEELFQYLNNKKTKKTKLEKKLLRMIRDSNTIKSHNVSSTSLGMRRKPINRDTSSILSRKRSKKSK